MKRVDRIDDIWHLVSKGSKIPSVLKISIFNSSTKRNGSLFLFDLLEPNFIELSRNAANTNGIESCFDNLSELMLCTSAMALTDCWLIHRILDQNHYRSSKPEQAWRTCHHWLLLFDTHDIQVCMLSGSIGRVCTLECKLHASCIAVCVSLLIRQLGMFEISEKRVHITTWSAGINEKNQGCVSCQ